MTLWKDHTYGIPAGQKTSLDYRFLTSLLHSGRAVTLPAHRISLCSTKNAKNASTCLPHTAYLGTALHSVEWEQLLKGFFQPGLKQLLLVHGQLFQVSLRRDVGAIRSIGDLTQSVACLRLSHTRWTWNEILILVLSKSVCSFIILDQTFFLLSTFSKCPNNSG